MKILYITNDFFDEIGGLSQHVDQLTKHVSLQENVVILYLNVHGRTGAYVDEYGRCINILPHPGSLLRRVLTFPQRRIREFVQSENPHLIHIHSPVEAARVLAHHKIPMVYTNHSAEHLHWGSNSFFRNGFLRPMLRKFHCVICPSQACLYNTPHPHAVLIPNGVDLQEFSLPQRLTTDRNQVFQARLGVPYNAQRVFLIARRLVKDKGVFDLIRANIHYLHTDASVLFLIAGDGPEMARIQALVTTEQLINVRLLGWVPPKEMRHLYYISDFCIIPSQYEVAAVSAIEAMASGAIALVTNVGGLGEVIEDGVTGLHMPPCLLLADILKGLDDWKLGEIRQTAYERVLHRYNWVQLASETINLYHRIVHPP